ncbi:MAG: cohesin domain-containing protein [Oscillospiraceae bacterium]|nr:cohesin domain-containing protein [Oscillospiraceae bacterium]
MGTKRFFAGAVAFVMTVMSTAAMTASAADTVKVAADKVTAAAGKDFSLNVSLSGVPKDGIRACEFALKYDSSIIEVTGVKAGTIADTGADAKEADISKEAPSFGVNFATAGVVNVEWSTGLTSSDYWIKSDGVLFTVEGTVKSTAKAGDVSKVEIVPIDRALFEGSTEKNTDIVFANISGSTVTNYEVSTSDGSVTVEGAETTETDAPTETTKESTTETSVKPDLDVDYGDTNVDGEVGIADVVLLNKYLVKSASLSDQGEANADAYADGKLNADDSLSILKFLVGTLSELPEYPV